MTEQTIPTEEQVKEQFERITMARVRLLLNKSFFGSLATRLKVIDATQWCPTAGTDGKHLYINVNFCTMKAVIFNFNPVPLPVMVKVSTLLSTT